MLFHPLVNMFFSIVFLIYAQDLFKIVLMRSHIQQRFWEFTPGLSISIVLVVPVLPEILLILYSSGVCLFFCQV